MARRNPSARYSSAVMHQLLSGDQHYQAVVTRDRRFDGRFFVAVKTTGIYCRPICRVKTPQRKSCTFFSNAAAAEAAGYRPCKRCRPELAPGSSVMDASSALAKATARNIADGFLADHSLEDLSAKLGVTDRQMRRVFQTEFGVSPVEYWQTQRLLLAKQLLTDSKMSVTTIAFASGFQSVRRFNSLLKKRYRMSPSDLRKTQRQGLTKTFSDFSFGLSYRPPLDWGALLRFLSARAIPGVETVEDETYARTVRIRHGEGELFGDVSISHDPQSLRLLLRMSDALMPASATILERARQSFDLHADPGAIGASLATLGGLRPGLRVPGCFDAFEMAVRAILGQQVSVAGATTLAGRFAARFGDTLDAAPAPLAIAFPGAARVARLRAESIATLGIIRSRGETIITLAKELASGRILLEPGHRIEETLTRLQAIPGIGEWTAQYIAMRALSWPDAFPHTDLGIRKAMRETKSDRILKRADEWRPWRAYAALHLWSTLETEP